MVSLLVVSLALSASAAATQTVAAPNDSVVAQSSQSVELQQGSRRIALEEPTGSFDPIAIQPDSDICYKIRAYIFSKGSNPKLIRETTCGPKRPSARQVDGAQPKLMPLDAKDKSADLPQK
jgi:hypothetical protein